jgi:3-deoxy-D-manno-octulosonate 8-phosphate phosphatase (KDO 8-P phosphatase)
MAKPLTLAVARKDPRFKKIKLLLLDVDGVLTDGTVQWIEGQGFTRTYHINDGYGIKLLQSLGVPVGIISGGSSKDLQERIKLLQIQHVVLGSEDKLTSLEKISKDTGIPFSEICFVGDELFDIPALRKVGLSITVPNGMIEVKKIAHYITSKAGGQAAVREVIDAIRAAQNLIPDYL